VPIRTIPYVRFNDLPKLEHLKQQDSGLVNHRWTLRHPCFDERPAVAVDAEPGDAPVCGPGVRLAITEFDNVEREAPWT
jgi:hypothetical protein